MVLFSHPEKGCVDRRGWPGNRPADNGGTQAQRQYAQHVPVASLGHRVWQVALQSRPEDQYVMPPHRTTRARQIK